MSSKEADAGILGVINAGTVDTDAELITIDPWLIAYSPTNPRKRKGLDIESLRALADSLAKTGGPLQPPLVRPLPGGRAMDTFQDREEGRPLPQYELVCGERRVRGSRIAELGTIRVLLRNLSDDEALELQLVENIEREDLDPLEEAEGFALLRERLGYSAEKIAERIGRGKGESYVLKSLKLLELTPESREALYDGHLGRSTALLVARYPADQQADVVQYIGSMATTDGPAPFRQVSVAVHRRFNLQFSRAVWKLDDADLVPAAGACSSCPKRSGANPDLFSNDHAAGEDSCTDAACFESKRNAHVVRITAQAARDKIKVIDGAEAQRVAGHGNGHFLNGFTRLDAVAHTEEGDDGKVRRVTFGDALRAMGKKAPKPRLLIHPVTGEGIEVITDELADQLLPEEDDDDDAKGHQGNHVGGVDRPPEHQALDDHQVRRAVYFRLFDAIRTRDRTDGDMLLIAKALFTASFQSLSWVLTYLAWDDDLEDQPEPLCIELAHAKLDALPAAEVAAIVTMIAVEALATDYSNTRTRELAIANGYGVDVLAVRDKVAEDLARKDETGTAATEDGDEQREAYDEAMGEADPAAGARVRIKEGLRGPNGKLRKICGREGVLTSRVDGGWMFQGDGNKEQARVERSDFELLPVEGGTAAGVGETADADGVPDGYERTANWPWPVKKKADA